MIHTAFRALILILFILSSIFFNKPVLATEGQILLSDDFNDGNLDGWTVESGNWYINNGNLAGSNSGRSFGGRIDTGSSEWDNYRLDLDVNGFQGIDQGVGVRYTQNGSYEVNLRYGTGIYDTPQVRLWKKNGNDYILLTDTHSFPLINNKWYHVTIEAFNENIKVWIDNTLIFDFTDTGTQVKKGILTLSYWTGDVGVAYMRFDNINVTSLVPLPTPTPTPTPTPLPSKIPLILIPGIGGSELKVAEDTIWNKDDGHGGVFNRAYAKDEVVWLNEQEARVVGEDDYFDVLRMKLDGINSEANLNLTNNLLARAYQNTIDFFTSNGYTLNKDFFVFPYDWRKDITTTKIELDSKISQIKSQTGSTKVDIIAHSMGGLVARYYIADPAKATSVRKLFTLGTPHLGSVEAIKKLRYGDCLTPLPVSLGPLCLGIINSEMRDVLQNMISSFELAPSQSYFNFYSGDDNQHPYPYRTESGALNYTQIKNLLTAFGHNTSLYNQSEAFHSIDTDLSNTNGVDVTIIAGSGQSTLGQIIEEKTTSLLGIQSTRKDVITINGDDTVPLFSASLSDTAKNQSLLGSSKLYYTNQKHGNLVTTGPALNLVKNILEDNTQLPTDVSAQAYSFSGTTLSVHSPVNIHVYDSNGNHTGPTADGFEANIPGSSYNTLGDAKFVYLPKDGVYTVKFEATDQGSFDFKIRDFENDLNTQTTLYKDISLTTSTRAETIFDTASSQPPILQVDQDGNGAVDSQVNSSVTLTGNANYDLTPPKTTIKLSGTEGNNNWYKSDVIVSLEATDEENGSGIQKIEYALDNGQTIQTYTQPFAISQEGLTKLKVKATDKAGNEEAPQEAEIKIDKTAPEAKVYVDQDKQDLVVEGIDANPTSIVRQDNLETKKKDDAVYKIDDSGGNTLKLDVRERDKEKKDRFRIYSIQYNDNPAQILENNHFNVNYQGKKDRLNVKEQNFELKGEVKIRIKYDSKKNKSTIIVKEPKEEKIKEVKDGLILLQLLTKKGQLEIKY